MPAEEAAMILLRSHIQKSHKEKRSRKGSHFFSHNGTPVNEHATVTTVRVADHANQNEFVKAPDGSDYFGEITAEVSIAIRRQAGLITLRQGDETEGLEHINRPARLAQLQSVGYQSGIGAVYDVARNYDAVYPGKKGNLLLIKRAKPQTLIYIRLEPSKHGDYYDVKTATPARQDALKNKKPLWERAQSNQIQENPSLRDLSSQSGSDVRNKIPPQNDEIKKSGLYLIKAHVRDYDRVSKTGAIEHIRAHEDHRVRSYARKILGSANSYDLHKIRRDRFGHLPHWNKLDDHTRQTILDAEEEKAKGHKEFEEWVETHGSKKGKKKDAEKVDRSGWEQQLMFKSRRVQHVAHILRKSNVRSSTHANAAGKVWQQSSYTNKVVAKAKAEQLLTAPNGTADFGTFHQEASEATGYPSAAIRLQIGEHNDKTGKGYGKAHIKSRHWKKEIKPAGYASVLTFVEDVASNFDAVYQVDKGRLALVKEDGNLAAIVEIERKDGEEFYKVITAYIANKNKFADQTPLWRRSQSSHPETGDQEPSELGLAKSVEVSLRQRYPTSTDGQSGAVTTNLSPPKNKSNNPLHLFRRRGC